jgi:DNA-binding GntR family transcriptional regulator
MPDRQTVTAAVSPGAPAAARTTAAGGPRRLGGRSVPRHTLQTLVTARLREAILSGRLTPGARLQQDDLARELGVSRMPIREALRVLHSEGLAELQPHRGAVVTNLKPEEIEEVFEIRAMLEARAATLAAPHLRDATLERMRALCEEMEAPGLDDAGWLARNHAFHTLIYPASRWPRLCALIEAQRNVTRPYLAAATTLTARRPGAQREHRQLLDAAARGDGPRLAALTEEHLRTTARRLIAYVAGRRPAEGLAARRA